MINWPLIAALLLPNIGGFASALTLIGQVKRPDGLAFYQVIRKPSWTPPGWVFRPVWLCLYLSMGYASFMVFRDGGPDESKMPLALYIIHLAFNWSWVPIFFRFHRIGLALLNMLTLDVLATTTAAGFYHINPYTAYFMVPYLCWLAYATALNFAIWKLNSTDRGSRMNEDYKNHVKFHYIT